MHNYKLAWKLKTDSAAAGFRYFNAPAFNADGARSCFHTFAADLGLTQGETRIIYVSILPPA